MVYLIVAYDVQADRTGKLRKPLRQYLTHVQNSVFEGRVTAGQADDIESFVRNTVQETNGESVIIYRLKSLVSNSVLDRLAIGDDPTEDDQFL